MGFLGDLLGDVQSDMISLRSRFAAPPQTFTPPFTPHDPQLGVLEDGSFFLGQPQTVTPFPLVLGTTVLVPDPIIYGPPSKKVQVQNATGFQISVITGIGQFTLQPLTAATVPTDSGVTISITPTAGVTNFSELLTCVFLKEKQMAPMQDGSLTASPTPGTPLSAVFPVQGLANGSNAVVLLPAAPAGQSYQLFNLIWVLGAVSDGGGGGGPGTIYSGSTNTFLENTTPTVLWSLATNIVVPALTPPTTITETYSLLTVAVQTEQLTFSALYAGTALGASLTLNYYLIGG
jgi:hypothetical protein